MDMKNEMLYHVLQEYPAQAVMIYCYDPRKNTMLSSCLQMKTVVGFSLLLPHSPSVVLACP